MFFSILYLESLILDPESQLSKMKRNEIVIKYSNLPQ